MSVTYEVRDHVAIVTFDDGKANSLGTEALAALNGALDRVAGDPDARAVLLVGRPGRFSAGFDLKAMTAGGDTMRELVMEGARFVARLLLEPRPVVAACTGHALAAGALVLLAADHRIGIDGEWKIGLNEVSIGMALPKWAVELARYRLHPSEFDWRVVLGQVCDPAAAVRAGFLDRVVAPDDLLAEATATASALAALRTGAVEGTKRRARGPVAAVMLDGLAEDMADVAPPQAG